MRKLACFVLTAALLCSQIGGQNRKPDFSGRWETNVAKSSFGRMPAPKSHVDTVEHKEPALIITTVTEDARGASTIYMKLTTDNQENLNAINGNEFRSKTRWDGSKLITVVTGDRGLSMTEVRSLSTDGKTQTVEMYMGEMRGEPQVRRVMDRK